MAKKIISFMLAIILVATVFTGCASQNNEAQNSNDTV